jgi:hypothetical protein
MAYTGTKNSEASARYRETKDRLRGLTDTQLDEVIAQTKDAKLRKMARQEVSRRKRLPANTLWTPFQRATPVFDPVKLAALKKNLAASHPEITEEMVEAQYMESLQNETWLNSKYQVQVRRPAQTSEEGPTDMPVIHLSIKRIDKQPIHDWRDLQKIKTELLGAEIEAIELYPAESRVVDTANQYHLWCFPEGYQVPVGWTVGLMIDGTGEDDGTVQRSRET